MNNISTTSTKTSNSWDDPTIKTLNYLVAYISLFNVLFGFIGNTICFLVLITSKDLKRMSYAVYLMYCSIVNILSLLQWNFNHFLRPIFAFNIEDTSIINCRFFTFLQYFSLQCGAYLLCWMCIDRFITVIAVPGSLSSRLPFSTPKTAHIWSILTIFTLTIMHSHILMFNGYYDPPEWRNMTTTTTGSDINQTSSVSVLYLYQSKNFHCFNYSPTLNIFPMWNTVHLYLYTIVPFIIMITFNMMLISKSLWRTNKNLKINRACKTSSEKRRLSRSLFIITMSFLILTSPANIVYGYFEDANSTPRFRVILHILDCIAFMHQSMFFINCYFSNNQFRRKVIGLWKQKTNHIMSFVRLKRSMNTVHQLSIVSANTDTVTKTKEKIEEVDL